MKVNKKKVTHWIYLLVFTFNVIVSVFIGLLVKSKCRDRVILYGHKLNGNIRAIYDTVKMDHDNEIDIFYLTMDQSYIRSLKQDGYSILNAINLFDIVKVINSAYIVSDHGLHALILYLKLSKIKFIDVWHGIPFKGLDETDFNPQRQYDAVFVASNSMKRMYHEKYGFDMDRIVVTGYARTDRLVTRAYDKLSALKRYSLPDGIKIVLIAPTWSHAEHDKTEVPFGMSIGKFLSELNRVGVSDNIHFIIRSHLNSASISSDEVNHITFLSSDDYPDTEEILYLSDVLVSDWSSIVFDYLVLARPTIFVDKPCPFVKGFSYGPEYRFGDIVKSLDDMISSIRIAAKNEADYLSSHFEHMEQVRSEVYGQYSDGNSTSRAVKWILDDMRA